MFYFHEEVEQRGYPGLAYSIQFIESRLLTEGQVAFLGGAFVGENLGEALIESFGTVFKGQTKPSDFFGGQMFCVGSR